MSKSALPRIVLIVLVVGGATLRADFARHAVPFADDYATAALESKHILEGRDYPLHLYGPPYIGALGAYVGAGVFALFGPSLFSLCLAMLLFALLWIFATYLLFRRLGGDWGGVIAAAVVAFPPITIAEYSVVPLIGYPPTFALGTLILYLGVRLNGDNLTGRAEWFCVLGLGALAGLAIWTNPLSAPYLVMGSGLLIVHLFRSRLRRALLLKIGVGFVVFLAALLPVIVMIHRRGLHGMFGLWPLGLRFVTGNFRLVLDHYLPGLLMPDVHAPQVIHWLVQAAYAVLGVGLVAGLAVALVQRDRRVVRAALVPLAFAVVFLVLFLADSKSSTGPERYFTPFYLAVVGCVAFPLAHGRRWFALAGALLVGILVVCNLADTLVFGYGERARTAAQDKADLEELAARAQAAGLHHVMVPNYYGQAMTFVADERVIFVRTTRERYYPYAVHAAEDDHAGFAKLDDEAEVFAHTLEALGVSLWDSFSAGGWTVFYNIALPGERLDWAQPAAVEVLQPDGSRLDAAALIDRNEETAVEMPLGPGAVLVADFGRPVELVAARLTTPNRRDLPVGYTFTGSLDGETWQPVQHVGSRDVLACICGNRLQYGGPFTPMECRFPPARLQYLRLSDVRTASRGPETWKLSEVFFYTLAPDQAKASDTGRPDETEAAMIARELGRRGISLVIADEWLSRKIEQTPGTRPGVLPHWEARFPETHVPQLIPIRATVAVVTETAHAQQAAGLLGEATVDEVTVARRAFPHYTALIIEKAPADYESFSGLRWNGFTVVGTERIPAAEWYYRHGTQLEQAGDPDGARRAYQRAFETFPGIPSNLRKLAPYDAEAKATLAQLTPAVAAPVRFPGGASLVGYTLTPSPLMQGERATLQLVWALEGRVKHNFLQVFVHFRDGNRRVLQADHNSVFPVRPGCEVPYCLVLDEHAFTVPPGAPLGELTIYLGATSAGSRSIRLRPRTKCPVWNQAAEIGRVEIVQPEKADD